MKQGFSLPSTKDSISQNIQAEFAILKQKFESPKLFALFIVEQTKREVVRNLFVGQSVNQKEKPGLAYSRFLISRARATGMRSLLQEQNWYLLTLAELKNLGKKD